MADRSGYIGRAPGDSSVIIARQTFEPTGIQTDFTFASGYTPGYLDVYLNGSRLIVASDYTATDGSVVGLTTNALNGDVLECVAYKAFNLGSVTDATGDFTVGGDLTVNGTTTLGAGASVSYATTSFGLSGSPNIAVNNITGVAVTFTGAADFNGALDVDGHTELDDVNVSGASTFAGAADFNGAIDVDGHTELDDLNVSGVSTFTGAADFNGAIDVDGHTELDNLNVSGVSTFAGGALTGAYDATNSATSGISLQDTGRLIARRQNGSDVVWRGLYGSTTGSEITAAGAASFKGIDLDGPYKQAFDAITAATTPAIDCSLGNYFTLDASSTYPSVGWSFTNVPASVVYSCIIKVTTGGSTTINWNSVAVNGGGASNKIKWSGGAVPAFTAGKPLYIILTTDDTGATWQGTSLIDFAVV